MLWWECVAAIEHVLYSKSPTSMLNLHCSVGFPISNKFLAPRSQSLRETGERLVEERQQLIEFASAIRSRLLHFEELEKIATQFHTLASSQSSTTPVESGEVDPYLVLLKRLDESISYVSSHPQYAEASLYMTQFKRLQAQALGGIRHRVTSVLKTCTQKFLEGLSSTEDNDLEVGHSGT